MQYMTLSPLRFNGTHYDQGDTLELSSEDARELIATKTIQPIHVPFSVAAALEV